MDDDVGEVEEREEEAMEGGGERRGRGFTERSRKKRECCKRLAANVTEKKN